MSTKLEWEAYDRIPNQHGPDWYWAVGIIAASIAVTAVILDNMLFAVLIVLATIVLFLRTLQKPQLIHYELTNRGFWTNKDFESYSSFASFWVEEEQDLPKLILTHESKLSPLSIIYLEDIEPQEVRAFLLDYLPEVEQHEPFAKRFMEYLGF